MLFRSLTTVQIEELKAEPPYWLQHERDTQAEVRREAARIKDKHREEAERASARR